MEKAFNRTQTDDHSVERDLRDSNARLMGIIESAMDAIITIDEDQRIQLFNKSAEKMFGYRADEVMGKKLDILLPPRYRDLHRDHVDRFKETGVTNRSMGHLDTLYGLRASGEEFPIEASISQVNTSNGRMMSVILRDISARVAAEEHLKESEQYLRATFEQAGIGIAHQTVDGKWLRANQWLSNITGYSTDEILNLSFQEITHPDDLKEDMVLQNQLVEGRLDSFTREKRMIHKNGSIIWINMTVSLVRELNGNPKYFIKIYEDITRRKEAEQALKAKNEEVQMMMAQLWQTAKLATMGELAASVAHELNNPLAIISLRIESLLSSLSPESRDLHELEIVAQEVDRMANLVGNLLQYSRSNERQVSSLDIREELDRTLSLVQSYLMHRHINVERVFQSDVPLIHADRQQLRQLFLNLFTNATDAMPNGGTLTVSVEPFNNEKQIRLQISDTGVGIPPEILQRVTEPFYTTKANGKGTGLGLAICRRIVEDHRGAFKITSPGIDQGATVEILLPTSSEARPIFIDD